MSDGTTKYRFLMLPRYARYTLLVYDRPDTDNPAAACQFVFQGGDYWKLDTLISADEGVEFYSSLPHGGFDELRAIGALIMRAEVRLAHLRLMRRKLEGHAEVVQLPGEREIARPGRTPVRVVPVEIRLRDKPAEGAGG